MKQATGWVTEFPLEEQINTEFDAINCKLPEISRLKQEIINFI
jgi:hypothetical protein